MFRKLGFSALVALTLCTVAFPAHAALTDAQIQSILSLLQSFGAEQSVVESVNASLRGIPAPAPSGESGIGSCVVGIARTLSLGVRGDDVSELQRRLTAAGVYTGPVTGYFGPLTRAAVVAYQKKYGLDQVGVVGPKTRELLKEQCAPSVPAPTPEPSVPVSPPEIPTEEVATGTPPVVTVPDTVPPSCSLTATRKSPIVGYPFTLSWTSEHAKYGVFDPNTTNTRDSDTGILKKDLPLSTGNLPASGSEVITPTTSHNGAEHVVMLTVYGDAGTASCSISIEAFRENATGFYEVYADNAAVHGAQGITYSASLSHCMDYVAANSGKAIRCLWRGDQIYP